VKSSDVPEDYVKKETAILRTAGFDDEEWIAKEVARRWDKVKPTESTGDATDTTTLPVLLNEGQMDKANLVLIGDEDGVYKYIKSPSKAPKASAKAAAKSEKKEVKVAPEESDSETEKEKEKDKKSDRKRKAEAIAEADDGSPDDDDDYMKFAMEFVTTRLLKHADKETMAPMLVKFGVPGKGAKTEMAQALAEQLCYETGEEDEEVSE
jgi:hypothetical protein